MLSSYIRHNWFCKVKLPGWTSQAMPQHSSEFSDLRYIQLCLRKGSLVLPESTTQSAQACCLHGQGGRKEEKSLSIPNPSFAQVIVTRKAKSPSQEGVFTVLTQLHLDSQAPVWPLFIFLELGWRHGLPLISTASSFVYLALGGTKFKL